MSRLERNDFEGLPFDIGEREGFWGRMAVWVSLLIILLVVAYLTRGMVTS